MTMRFYLLICCIVVTIVGSCIQLTHTHYIQQWAVHIPGGLELANEVAKDHGFINHGVIFDDHYFFSYNRVTKRSFRSSNPDWKEVSKDNKFKSDKRILWWAQQKAKKRVKRDLNIQDSDPKWPNMWYLNRGHGLDMNVIPAWLEGITGKGAVVTILDDGLEKDHPDLIKNYDPLASYDVNNQDADPSPRYDMVDSNRHGTRCAGEVAATSNNSVCALGIAHGAQVGGVRMLDGEVTDAVEARSLSYNPQHIDIYSASWGPDDDGKTVDGPGELATRAFLEGVTKGRNGKGSIFVWASGNGGREHDNCNCDGYTNSIYTLSISSATEYGNVPWYSEMCSSTLASTYSSGAVNERQVVTTDLRHSCTSSHTGTSASAPLAAGICALALEANPNLTWRDMQHIVVRTARPQYLLGTDWQVNGVGRNVSHSFGYGLMDAYAMVKLAKNWITVPKQNKCEISAPDMFKSIPAKGWAILHLHVLQCDGVEILEHVQAKLTIYAFRRGDLHIELMSPMGTRVILLTNRDHDNSRAGFTNWPFMSVHSWGESPFGVWELKIHNNGRLMGRATLQNWSLILYGTKHFLPLPQTSQYNRSSSNRLNKTKLFKNLKKNKSKQKIKNQHRQSAPPTASSSNYLGTIKASAKTLQKLKLKPLSYQEKSTIERTFNTSTNTQLPVPTNMQFSPYIYLHSNKNNMNTVPDSVMKHYLTFVKNITITYPLMIPPAADVFSGDRVPEKKNFRKGQNLIKEKSRDINFRTNMKDLLPSKANNKKNSSADVQKWNLTLYGTITPPVYDLKTHENADSVPNIYTDDIIHNSIDPSAKWNEAIAENRKDTLAVEQKEDNSVPSSSSSCKKFQGNVCLECFPNEILHNGNCLISCPYGYYSSKNDLQVAHITTENQSMPDFKCLRCHYTCKQCLGSNDYQCLECYADAQLYTRTIQEKVENYCYPISITQELSSIKEDNWYYRIFLIIMNVLIIVIVILILGAFYAINKRKNYLVGYSPISTSRDVR